MKQNKLIALLLCVLLVFSACGETPDEPYAQSLQTTGATLAETEPIVQQTLPSVVEPGPEPEPEDKDFVLIRDYLPTAKIELAYATENNFTGSIIYDFTDAYLRYGTVKKLAQVSQTLEKQGIGLIVWDGFRPVYAQAKLWEMYPDPTFVSHPVTGKRTHCRGNTVDVSVYDMNTGNPLPVPTGFDDFSQRADRDYSDCTDEQATNATLLEQTMIQFGFKPYSAEWWHFTDEQDYPVDEYFDPAVPMIWSLSCEEFVSLRQSPGGEVICRIPKGETVRLKYWENKYAKVSWKGQTGYVLSSYITPGTAYLPQYLDVVKPTASYSYEQMLADMQALSDQHPDAVSLDVAGESEQGRQIAVIRIGDVGARHHVMVQGAIHGREHVTAWLMMAMADYWLTHGLLGYGDVCYHMIPMSNPDGVVISQTGQLSDEQMMIYRQDLESGYTSEELEVYASRWKANSQGVDINRNFSAGWDAVHHRTAPSSQLYQGTEPFSTSEARALRDYTLRYDFDVTVSYHASGSCLYWEYGTNDQVNTASQSLGNAVKEVTGYGLEGSSSVDGAGYKDWAMDVLEVPSLTIEIGCGDAPLEEREIFSIFVRNYRVLPAVARWMQS